MDQLEQKGYSIRGCELDPCQVARLNERATSDRVIAANGARLPLEDNAFDSVTSCDVLEHVLPEQRQAFLDEMLRIAKPGGRIVLTAWFHNTRSFRLYGASHLMLVGTLPDWYVEHLQIPLPSAEIVNKWFVDHCDDVKSIPYQGSMNLFVMLTQNVAAARGSRNWLRRFRFLNPLAKNCDWLGRRTSCLFVGTKRGT